MNGSGHGSGALVKTAPAGALDLLRAVPEERVWIESQQSPATRRAYGDDVAEFLRFYAIETPTQFRKVDRLAVIAWRRHLEASAYKASSIRRKLAALSSLFAHLVERHVVRVNPVRDVARPRINRRMGLTPAFSREQGRRLLDAPDPGTLRGLRDRAILAVGLQVGPRRSEIAALRVRDLYKDRGFDCLRLHLKGGTDNAVGVHPAAAERIRDYLAAAGHAEDLDGPLFRSVRPAAGVRRLDAKIVDRVVKTYARQIGLPRGYSAHSLRAAFITTALENGAALEAVQRAAGHAHPDTTQLYDRRGFNPERSASFFASY